MRLKNGSSAWEQSPHPSSAFILIKLESAVGQIVLAKVWVNYIYACVDKFKRKQIQRSKPFIKEVNILQSAVQFW